MPRNFDWNRLYLFFKIARHEKLTRTAEELHLTQSALSQQLKILEDELGFALFHRVKNRLALTTQGRNLYRVLSAAYPSLKTQIDEISAEEGNPVGEIRFASLTEFTTYKLIPLLTEFSTQFPDVNFKILYPRQKQALKLLLQAKIDFAIVDEVLNQEALDVTRLFSEEICLVKSRQLRLSWADLEKQSKTMVLPFVAFESTLEYPRRWFSVHGLPKIRIKLRVVTPHVPTMMELVKKQFGLALLPYYLVEKDPDLEVIKPGSVASKTLLINQIDLLTIRKMNQRKVVKQFIDFVRSRL